VVELRPIPWDNVQVLMLSSGRLAYDVTDILSTYGGTGRSRRLLQGEVIHLKDRSDDGLVGKSRLQRAAAAIDAGLAVQTFGNAMFANGANPSGVIKADGRLTDEQRKHLRENFERMHKGPQNAARALLLDQGLQWQSISVSPEDAELLASRRFSTEELARIFQVPPPLVGIMDHATFTNSETAGRWYAQHTLTPWVRKIEAEFTRSVFSEAAKSTHELEIDLSGFLRGDHAARWEGHSIAVKNGILTPNEIREVEGYNPRDGGDETMNGNPAQGREST
jgi:HK97 family phage portal protein